MNTTHGALTCTVKKKEKKKGKKKKKKKKREGENEPNILRELFHLAQITIMAMVKRITFLPLLSSNQMQVRNSCT